MFADGYVRVQHCDTTAMLSTPQRSARETRYSEAAEDWPAVALYHTGGQEMKHPGLSQHLSALICDKKSVMSGVRVVSGNGSRILTQRVSATGG